MKKAIILASGSPRRRELMTLAGFEFTVVKTDCDETLPDGIAPADAVVMLSGRKAREARKNAPEGALIVAADTVVAIDGRILGKPADKDDAAAMLRELSGRTHTVYTGVCVMSDKVTESFFEATDVTFFPLTDEEINAYVATGEPMDKAGAYGIQGLGGLLCERINGDYYNIVGLPIAKTARVIRKLSEN